jgi:hypothetical protein
MLFCMISYATAGTVSIGTASARGDMRVDGYMVKGNATLFNGSVVETGEASADLRLEKGTEVTMATGSLGTLYSDRLVLQRGQTEFASNSFQLQANGLHVTPSEPNSRGVVTLKSKDTVEVASLNGSFGVTTDRGVLLASVRPGRALTFALQAAGSANGTSSTFTDAGLVSVDNGQYYLVDIANVTYKITGKDFSKFVNTKVQISGTLQQNPDGTATINVTSISINGGAGFGMSSTTGWIITGVAVGAGTALGVAIYETNKTKSPASP